MIDLKKVVIGFVVLITGYSDCCMASHLLEKREEQHQRDTFRHNRSSSTSLLPTVHTSSSESLHSEEPADENLVGRQLRRSYTTIGCNSFSHGSFSVVDSHLEIPRELSPIIEPPIVMITCDGGGARGNMCALLLYKLLTDLEIERFPSSIVFAGTSVGALILAAHRSGNGMLVYQDFKKIADSIFKKNTFSISGLLKTQYANDGRQRAIQEYTQPKDAMKTPNRIMIPICSSATHKPLLYDSQEPMCSMMDALMGTTAVPGGFSEHSFIRNDGLKEKAVDGGVHANNPSEEAYMIIRNEYPTRRIILFSIGTGVCDHYYGDDKPHFWNGLLPFMGRHGVGLLLEPNSFLPHKHLSSRAGREMSTLEYHRIDPPISSKNMNLYDTSTNNLEALNRRMADYIAIGGAGHTAYTRLLAVVREEIAREALMSAIVDEEDDADMLSLAAAAPVVNASMLLTARPHDLPQSFLQQNQMAAEHGRSGVLFWISKIVKPIFKPTNILIAAGISAAYYYWKHK